MGLATHESHHLPVHKADSEWSSKQRGVESVRTTAADHVLLLERRLVVKLLLGGAECHHLSRICRTRGHSLITTMCWSVVAVVVDDVAVVGGGGGDGCG